MAAGAAYHLAFAGLLKLEGINPKSVTVVPSQGAAPGFQELASGGVQIVPSSLPEGKPMIDAGRVKSLAVLSKEKIGGVPKCADRQGSHRQGLFGRNMARHRGAGQPSGRR